VRCIVDMLSQNEYVPDFGRAQGDGQDVQDRFEQLFVGRAGPLADISQSIWSSGSQSAQGAVYVHGIFCVCRTFNGCCEST